VTAKDDELLHALADADPAKLDPPPALGSERYQAILEAAMSKESTPEIHEFPSGNPSMNQPRRRTRPVLRLALIAAVAVIALAAVTIAVLRRAMSRARPRRCRRQPRRRGVPTASG
jgi:hypothetical protein